MDTVITFILAIVLVVVLLTVHEIWFNENDDDDHKDW